MLLSAADKSEKLSFRNNFFMSISIQLQKKTLKVYDVVCAGKTQSDFVYKYFLRFCALIKVPLIKPHAVFSGSQTAHVGGHLLRDRG